MRIKRNLPGPWGRAPLQAGPRSARARRVAPAEQSLERRVCFHTLAHTEQVRISFLSNTVADLNGPRTRIISEPPSKPSQIPLKKKNPRAVQIRTGFVSTAKCWKSIYRSVRRRRSSAGCTGSCGGSVASEAAKREVTSARSEVPKGREIRYADHVVRCSCRKNRN